MGERKCIEDVSPAEEGLVYMEKKKEVARLAVRSVMGGQCVN